MIYDLPFNSPEEVIELLKVHTGTPSWITEARKNSKTLRALVYGDNFTEELIKNIEKIESDDRTIARKKFSKDIRDMFSRVLEPRANVFSASGGGVDYSITSKETKEKLIEHLQEFKGNKSITKYLSEYFFTLLDVDPNGLMMLEYIEDKEIYPAYKAIDDIRYYKSDGQNLKLLIFEPVDVVIGNDTVKKWRVVDSKTDWCFIQNGETFTWAEDLTFEHPFGKVPAIVLSDFQKLGTELRLSPLFPVEELSKDYARDKSILTVYKFLNGFPIHWRYNQQCRACNGTAKTGVDGSSCKVCDGKGFIGKNDVTDVVNVPMPREDEPKIAPDLAGFVSPDLETWERYMMDQRIFEEQIENTIWGTHKKRDEKNETATGRFIDVQPVMNKLNSFSDNVEWVHNELANWVLFWLENNSQTKDSFHRSYGRSFIIESPDVILDKYEKARIEGSNFTVLDKLLNEYALSKYRNNPSMLDQTMKKIQVEPYIHNTIEQVNDIFGNLEAQRKHLFGSFWEVADKSKDVATLETEFETYYNANKRVLPEPIVPVLPPT